METTKAVVLKGGRDAEWAIILGGSEPTAQVVQKALHQAAEKAKVSVDDIGYIIATGVGYIIASGMGREYMTFANEGVPESFCLARGIDFLLPSTRTLLDLGAGKSLAIKCSGGRVTKLATSSDCAAGSGACVEMVSNVLGVNIGDMDELSFKSRENVDINSTCAIFAESEIISLIHNGAKPEDILRGVFRGLAGRVYSQLLELGNWVGYLSIEKDIAVVGGVAQSKAIIAALEERVECQILVPENPQIVGALGAALIAQEERSMVS